MATINHDLASPAWVGDGSGSGLDADTLDTISSEGFSLAGHAHVQADITDIASGTVWTASNDGSGSGMDADLLDGVQATGYKKLGLATTSYTVGTGQDFETLQDALDYLKGWTWDNTITLKLSESFLDEADFTGVTGGPLSIQGGLGVIAISDIKTAMSGTLSLVGDQATVTVASGTKIPDAGGYIQIFGCTSPDNNGKFEVSSKAGDTITYTNASAVEESVVGAYMVGFPTVQFGWCEIPNDVDVGFTNLTFPEAIDVRGGTAGFARCVMEEYALYVFPLSRISGMMYVYLVNSSEAGMYLMGPCSVETVSTCYIVNLPDYGIVIVDSAVVCDTSAFNFVDCLSGNVDNRSTVDNANNLEGQPASYFATADHTQALAKGGTNADLSATGGTGQVLRQSSTGANVTVGTLKLTECANADNNTWLKATDFAGTSTVNVVKVNASDEIELGGSVNIPGPIEGPADGGAITLFDMPIVAAASGTEESFSGKIGGTTVIKFYGEPSGAGGPTTNIKTIVYGTIEPSTTAGTLKIGSSTKGFAGIYLTDTNGVEWLVTVGTDGVVTTASGV